MRESQNQDPEDMLFSASESAAEATALNPEVDANPFCESGTAPATPSDDDDWAPPVEPDDDFDAASLSILMSNQPGMEEPVQRNLLPGDSAAVPSPLLAPSQSSKGQQAPEGAEASTAESRANLATGSEVLVRGRTPTVYPAGMLAPKRASAVLVPVVVVGLGAVVAGLLAMAGGNHIMAGITLALSVVGGLLLRVFLRS